MSRRGVIAVAVMVLALASVIAASCAGGANYGQRTFASNGERIYFTVKNSSGDSIRHSGGPAFLFSQSNCASCHGADGRGNPDISVPDITWKILAREGQARFPWWYGNVAYAHSAHKAYTEKTLKIAIADGFRPDGAELNKRMPRWQMSATDLDDLVAFMKTL